MDLKAYYRRVREVEAGLPDGDVLVVSLATPDGGKAGVQTEMSRFDAARMIVEGRARAATLEESSGWKEAQWSALRAREEAEMRNRVNFRVVSADDLLKLQPAAAETRKGTKGEH